jgi:transcriptional regulator with XRE-family HTH domain
MKVSRKKIQLIMAKQQLNQKGLAELSGIPASTISYILSVERTTPMTLGKLAEALKEDPSELIGEEA